MVKVDSCIEQGGGLDGLIGPFQLYCSILVTATRVDPFRPIKTNEDYVSVDKSE